MSYQFCGKILVRYLLLKWFLIIGIGKFLYPWKLIRSCCDLLLVMLESVQDRIADAD